MQPPVICVSTVCILIARVLDASAHSNLYCNKEFTCSSQYTMGMNPKTNPNSSQLSNTLVHPMCWLDDCKPLPHCGSTYLLCNTVKFRDVMVKLHNYFKNVSAYQGAFKNKAMFYDTTNFQIMSYDLEMEFIASCMTIICVLNEEKDGENGCRYDPIANYYNMDIRNNLVMDVSNEKGAFGEALFTDADAFDDEGLLKKFLDVGWFHYEGTRSNYYNINLFGCSRRMFDIQYDGNGKANAAKMTLACVYRAEFNFSLTNVTRPENRCADCVYPDEKCSEINDNLCGNPRPYEENVFAPPFRLHDHNEYIRNGPDCTYSPLYDVPTYTTTASTRRTTLTFAPVTTNTPDSGTTGTPAPVTPSPVTPSPVTPSPVTPSPVTPSPVTPSPVTPSPVTPAPVTPSPVTPSPVTPSPVTPLPVTPLPVTPAPTNAPINRVIRADDSSSTDASSAAGSSDKASPTHSSDHETGAAITETNTDDLEEEDLQYLNVKYLEMLAKLRQLVPVIEKLFYVVYKKRLQLVNLWRAILKKRQLYDQTFENFTLYVYDSAGSLRPCGYFISWFVFGFGLFGFSFWPSLLM